MEEERVMLHPAAWWECPVCGTTNTVRLVEQSSPADEEKRLHERGEIALGFPERLTCDACLSTHPVEFDEAWGME